MKSRIVHSFLDGYCSTVQGLLEWFKVDLGFTELLLIHIGRVELFILEIPIELTFEVIFGGICVRLWNIVCKCGLIYDSFIARYSAYRADF